MSGKNGLFQPNELIFNEGDPGDCAYLVERGTVQVFVTIDGIEKPLRTLAAGEIFGEMSIIDNSMRSASCRAISEVHLITVNQEQLTDRLESPDPIVRLLMRAFMDRLREQNNGNQLNGTVAPRSVLSEREVAEKKKALDRISLENRIAEAFDADEFYPFYQPIYDLKTNQVMGCEALIRWIGSDGKIISPAVFIDVLEESSLILKVGRRIIEKCMDDLIRLRASAPIADDFFVSINVSGRQFADPTFVTDLEAIRSLRGVQPGQIKLEVTERIMTEGTVAIKTLQECRNLGYKLAIDDFGTGFSSLQYLASMPLNDLKVDRSFVIQMMTHEKPLSIVKTLIFLANLLSLNLIAEGIETKEQLAVLRMLGVQMGQGFFFAKPMPFSDFVTLVGGGEQGQKAA